MVSGRGLSQISQVPPPTSHSDHCHLSFNSNHLHLINTQLNQHYLSTHLTSVSCPILLTRSGLTPTLHSYLPQDYLPQDYLPQDYLPQDYLPQDYLPPVPRWSSVSPTSACLRHPSSSSVSTRGVCLPCHPRVPGKKTIISISFNFLSTSRYVLTILPCLPDCWIQINITVLFHILRVWSTSRNRDILSSL